MLDGGALTWNELRRGGVVQARVVGALMLREMRTRFGERRLGYVWSIIDPMIQIGMLVFLFSQLGRRPPLGTSYETFFLNGYIPYMIFSQIARRSGAAITANRGLLSFPPVKNMDTVWARIVLEIATGMSALLVIMSTFALFGIPVFPANPAGYVAGYFAIFAFGAGMGAINAVFSALWTLWSTIFGWITRSQYFLAGVFFVPDHLPPLARHLLAWNPLSHGILWVREGFYKDYHSIILDKPYFVQFAMVLLVTGLGLERLLRRRISTR